VAVDRTPAGRKKAGLPASFCRPLRGLGRTGRSPCRSTAVLSSDGGSRWVEEKILDLAIHALYLKEWVTYLMSNRLNRLQQGGRSAGLEAFLRQCGGRPDQFFALGESNRLPREGVDRCHGSVAAWSGRYASLSSALRKSNLAPCGGRTFKASMYRGIKEIRFQKSVSPSPRRALGPQTGDDAVRG